MPSVILGWSWRDALEAFSSRAAKVKVSPWVTGPAHRIEIPSSARSRPWISTLIQLRLRRLTTGLYRTRARRDCLGVQCGLA